MYYYYLGFLFGLLGLICAGLSYYFFYLDRKFGNTSSIEDQERLEALNTPFQSNPNTLNIVIFPFNNFGLTTDNNLSEGIYYKLLEFKKEKYLNANIRYYNDINTINKNRGELDSIAEKLNADYSIKGDFERFVDGQRNLTFTISNGSTKYEINEAVEFESFLKHLNDGDFTGTVETYAFLTIGYLEFIDHYEFTEEEWYLFYKVIKEKLNDENEHSLWNIITEMQGEAISIHKVFPLDEIVKNKEYGLSKYYPLFTRHRVFAKKFIELLKYKGESIKIGEIGYEIVDFKREMIGAGATEISINSYQILDSHGEEIDTIYVSDHAFNSRLKAPNGFQFPQNKLHFQIKNVK